MAKSYIGIQKTIKIVSFYSLRKSIQGKVFIDATYEGDLMASAGVSYHRPREYKNL